MESVVEPAAVRVPHQEPGARKPPPREAGLGVHAARMQVGIATSEYITGVPDCGTKIFFRFSGSWSSRKSALTPRFQRIVLLQPSSLGSMIR